MDKKCAKCKSIKDVSEFNKLKRASDGLNYRCKECCNEYYNSIYPKIKDNKIQLSKLRYSIHKTKILEQSKERYDSDKKRIYNKTYNTINRLKINISKNEYEKLRCANDPNYRLIKTMRKNVYRVLKNKKDRTFSTLGYTKDNLIEWLGGYPGINDAIDHKVPVSWFVNDTPISIISHYKNLQILSKSDNSKKSNSYADIIDYDFYEISIDYIKDEYKTKIFHYGK